MKQNQRASLRGPWKITTTVYGNRRNLFSLEKNSECHIATIVSGSEANVDRFDQYLSAIEATPDMLEALVETMSLLDDFVFLENPRAQYVANEVRKVLIKVGVLTEQLER